MERLINVLLDNPGIRGMGVDERTAAILQGDTIEVLGQGQVVLIEPAVGVASRPAESRPLSGPTRSACECSRPETA